MSLHDEIRAWMPDNGWSESADGRKVTGPNLNQGGQLTIGVTLMVINQLGWEKMLERSAEPGSLTTVIREAIEARGRTPASDVHKLTRQALDLFHTERREAKIAAAAARV